jgi:hypothetical protein
MNKYKKVFSLTNKGYELFEFPDGTKEWFLDGKLHREDGPAIEYPDGRKFWLFNGIQISLETKSDDPKVKKLKEYMKLQEILDS